MPRLNRPKASINDEQIMTKRRIFHEPSTNILIHIHRQAHCHLSGLPLIRSGRHHVPLLSGKQARTRGYLTISPQACALRVFLAGADRRRPGALTFGHEIVI